MVEKSVDMLGWLRKRLEEANPDLVRESKALPRR